MVLVHFSEIQIAIAVWFISMLFILFHWSMQDWALFYALGPCMSSLRSTYFLRQYSSGCFLLFFEFLMLWIYKSLGSWVAGQCFLEFCWLSGNSVDYLHCCAWLFRVLGSQQFGFVFAACNFGVLPKTLEPPSVFGSVSSWIYCSYFTVWGLKFSSLIHFEVVLWMLRRSDLISFPCRWESKGPNFISLQMGTILLVSFTEVVSSECC